MAAQDLSKIIATTAERLGPAVVGLGRGWGVGSGVVVDPGRVLTAAHVLRGEESTVSFADGRRETAHAAGVDRDGDLAVLEVDTGDVTPVEWAQGEPPGIGAPVLALANPGGRGLRVTHGFVSSARRASRGPRGRRIAGTLEHTAPLPRGSSGGPLVDVDGRLLGLNAVRMEGGLIIAVPAVAERVEQLARGERAAPRRLGVAVAPPRVARRLRGAVGLPEREGVLVRAVEDGSAAERAGVERGDLIVAAGGAPVVGIDALYAALDASGDTLALTIVRGTEERELEVRFDAEQAGAAA
jgi:S1-C subfamily serine protease